MSERSSSISASMLYDLEACEHRPWMDFFADPLTRDAVSPFVELLWRRGRAHEERIITGVEALNLRATRLEEREAATIRAMKESTPLIYGGRISSDDLLGEPNLLRLEADGKYIPGDIKSGAGEEGPAGDDDRKPKVRYAVQLALYIDILERLGFLAARRGFIWDIHGAEVAYDFTLPKGKKNATTLWDDYQQALHAIREILSGVRNPGPAYQKECKNCVWFSACIAEMERIDDLTLLPGIGRHKRQPFLQYVKTVGELSRTKPERFLDEKGRSVLPGVGADAVVKIIQRAALRAARGLPYLRQPAELQSAATELFFDIETDPMREHCYLHGFIERHNGEISSERYEGFFSVDPTPQGEHDAFAAAWKYVESKRPCVVYIYSKYERTWWRVLQQKYPDVCTPSDIEDLFTPATTVDLFEIVSDSTEWPTRDHSIKTLAQYLGFRWRDTHPSGAASIEWFDRYCLGDDSARQRLLEYNEDDCRAMRILADYIRKMPLAT